jgi:Co/Zn/Cd efflux system component
MDPKISPVTVAHVNDSNKTANNTDGCLRLYCQYEHDTKTRKPVLDTVTAKLKIIIFICTVFMLVEIAGGYLSSSIAIITDAFHLLSDLCGFFISFVALKLSKRKPTEKMNFGYQRVEVFGAFLR